jgi:predicted nucleic acid-binding protein
MSLNDGRIPGQHVAEPPMPWTIRPNVSAVIVDSGPLLALFNRADSWHERVKVWLALNPQAKLITTWPVMTEVCALLARRIHNEAALDFLRWAQRGALSCDAPVQASLSMVLQISVRFASLPFDLADASVAEAASRLKIRHILSVDSDFDVYRDPAGEPLLNVLRS